MSRNAANQTGQADTPRAKGKAVKLIGAILIFALLCGVGTCLAGCSTKSAANDEEAVTIMVTQGGTQAYFETLASDVKEKYGIDVTFVYETSTDPSDQLILDFANNNMQADIVFTNAKVNDDYLKDSCVDLAAKTNITTAFTYGKVRECTADDGGVYQLPVSSKLIGITYNATLMEEMGWEVPQTFDDMLDLKEKCDEADIPFSVSDLRETGHGFNYLFHLMGVQYLSSPQGTSWLNGFLSGEQDAEDFEEASAYFQKWVDNDLFGSLNLEAGWGATTQFSKTRALFCFAILNNSDGYQGPEYDEDGNETGKTLNDVHKSMPWISEDGTNNCFTYYDNAWIMVNKKVLDEGQEEKLERVQQILDYIVSDEFASYTASLSKDNYMSLADFEMGDDRLYSNFAEEIKNGFTQPWYYSSFDNNTIVQTGAVIGSYILNESLSGSELTAASKECNYTFDASATYESIFDALEANVASNLSTAAAGALGTVEEQLGYEDTAKLVAISSGLALQQALDEDGNNALVQVALLPYITDISDMQPWCGVAVENAQLYAGSLTKAHSFVLVPRDCGDVVGIYMTGTQIQELVDKGFDPSSRCIDATTGKTTFDSSTYGPYAYACVVKDGESLQNDTEYLVAVPAAALDLDTYNALADAGKVVQLREGSGDATANTAAGIELFFAEHPTVNSTSLTW